MKKRLLALVSVIMSMIIGLAVLPGCNLITTDIEKDMDQVVATVEINTKDEIYKKDLVMEYLNSGYMYVQYYGYSLEKTFNLILDNAINSRILFQYAMEELNKDASNVKNAEKGVNDPLRYLDETKIVEAKYSTYSAINSLLDSYSGEHDHHEANDTLVGEIRTTPTDAANLTEEKIFDDKKETIEKGFDVSSNDGRRTAFAKLVVLFENNGLLGDAFSTTGKIEDTDYFKQSIKRNYENQVLAIYEDQIYQEARNSVTFEDLEKAYLDKYEEQKGWDNATFANKFKEASLTSPILYSAYGKYGYVYNLLLGVSDDQTEEIHKIREENANLSNAKYAEKRKEILDKTTVKDLRSSWILSGYDGELKEDGEFIFKNDYTFAKDSANSLAFQGDVKFLAEDHHGAKSYSVTSIDTFALDKFIEFMDAYIGGDQTDSLENYASLGSDVYAAKTTANVAEYDAKINELLFAFSTDSGSLNTFKGYNIAPPVDSGEDEQYVETFGKAGRMLLEQDAPGYVVVASDYGYHVMFFSEVISVDYSYASLTDYLNKVMGETKTRDEWKAYYEEMLNDYEAFEKTGSYLYQLANNLITQEINLYHSEKETEIINQYRYEETDNVVIFEDRFADLFVE